MRPISEMLNLVGSVAPIASFILNLFLGWIAWSMRQMSRAQIDQAVARAVAKLDRKDEELAQTADAQDHRITVIEEALKALPTRLDLDHMRAALAELSRNVAAQQATLQAVKESNLATQSGVDRLYRFMLENSK